MQPGLRRPEAVAAIVVVALTLVCAWLYRNRWQPPAADIAAVPAGEPDRYSATVVRTVDDGTGREEFITRIARSGELRREEWAEQGAQRALIWRPDLGKYYLLALDRREYVEFNIISNDESQSPTATSSSGNASEAVSPDFIDRAFNDSPMPENVEPRALPDQTIEGHPCSVVERRETFADGHVEIARTYRARDLSGLAVRVEMESTASKEKVIIERRDIRTEVSLDEFAVPTGFKKVEGLSR